MITFPPDLEPVLGADRLPPLIGQSPCVMELWSAILRVCTRDWPLVLIGEPGTGRELAARHVHAASARSAGPFVRVHCATFRLERPQAQLWSCPPGPPAGEDGDGVGLFRGAEGGTLYLDDVGALDLNVQAAILRCLEQKPVVPLGDGEFISIDVRIIAATHRDLLEMVRAGTFLDELYSRLCAVRLNVPPLRQRRRDIALLAEFFLAQFATSGGEPVRRLAPDALAVLERYAWPGNVRELRSVLERAVRSAPSGDITAADLPPAVRSAGNPVPGDGLRRVVPLAVAERCLIRRALKAARGNQTQAAKMLGVERHRLRRLILRHKLETLARPRAS